jgi:hypothetical protein
VILMPRSLLVFSNEAYTEMSHSIEPEEFDEIQGAANSAYLSCEGGRMVLPRGERCSLTVCLQLPDPCLYPAPVEACYICLISTVGQPRACSPTHSNFSLPLKCPH